MQGVFYLVIAKCGFATNTRCADIICPMWKIQQKIFNLNFISS